MGNVLSTRPALHQCPIRLVLLLVVGKYKCNTTVKFEPTMCDKGALLTTVKVMKQVVRCFYGMEVLLKHSHAFMQFISLAVDRNRSHWFWRRQAQANRVEIIREHAIYIKQEILMQSCARAYLSSSRIRVKLPRTSLCVPIRALIGWLSTSLCKTFVTGHNFSATEISHGRNFLHQHYITVPKYCGNQHVFAQICTTGTRSTSVVHSTCTSLAPAAYLANRVCKTVHSVQNLHTRFSIKYNVPAHLVSFSV